MSAIPTLQLIRSRKTSYERKPYRGRWSGFYTRERTTVLLACGCTKTFSGMSAPVQRTACPNDHPTGFVDSASTEVLS